MDGDYTAGNNTLRFVKRLQQLNAVMLEEVL